VGIERQCLGAFYGGVTSRVFEFSRVEESAYVWAANDQTSTRLRHDAAIVIYCQNIFYYFILYYKEKNPFVAFLTIYIYIL
jgi:hypothetical protein